MVYESMVYCYYALGRVVQGRKKKLETGLKRSKITFWSKIAIFQRF